MAEDARDTAGMRAVFWIWAGIIGVGLAVMIGLPLALTFLSLGSPLARVVAPPLMGDGSWQVLDLPQVFGASEAVSLRYLKACHPGTGDDPYAAAEALDLAPSPDAGRRFPDFAALIAR
mgnify:CR=1 FL=1